MKKQNRFAESTGSYLTVMPLREVSRKKSNEQNALVIGLVSSLITTGQIVLARLLE